MRLIFYLVINTIAVMFAARILPGISIDSWITGFFVAIALGIFNTFVKPILLLLTLPINLVTLGLFTFIINAFLVWLITFIVPGFHVGNFLWAIAFSLIVSLVSSFLSHLAK